MGHYIRTIIQKEEFCLLPEHAVYWPSRRTLILADLHWGKAEVFQTRGIPVPESVETADWNRLDELMVSYDPARVVLLGDLFHSPFSYSEHLDAKIRKWRAHTKGVEVLAVIGNHDRLWKKVPHEWEFNWSTEFTEGGFRFSHLPEPQESAFTWAGHLHPTYVLSDAVDSLRLPCFHLSQKVGVLPAFNRFTRGVPMEKKKGDRVFVIADEKVWDTQTLQ